MAKSGISWTDYTHNWWWGCNEVTDEECGGCYARDFARSARGGSWNGTPHPETGKINPEIWGPPRTTTRRIFDDKHNADPYNWNSAAMKRDERMCVFSESMSDLFEFHPLLDAPRQVAFRTVENTPYLDYKLLTKRPQMISRMVPKRWLAGEWPRNGWAGFSAGSQKYLDERMPYVVDLPAPVIFISHEPASGPINIERLAAAIDPSRLWIITGGWSGPEWREHMMELDWARYVRDQCLEMGIAFFYKQASARFPGQKPELDGVLHHQWPNVPGVPGKLGGVRKAALQAA